MNGRDFDYDAELDRLWNEGPIHRDTWAIVHMARSLARIAADLHAIRVTLDHAFASPISLTRITLMPKSIAVGQTATAHITATKADGSVFPITSSDIVALNAAPADASFGSPTFNADGSVDVIVTGVNVDPNVAVTANVDGVASAPDTLTITAAPPATVTVTLQ